MDEKENEKQYNTTKYGENVPNMFAWISMDDQKRRAEELSKITQSKKKK